MVELSNRNCYIAVMTGSELKKRRKDLNLSQQKLSNLLDLSLSTVARWEQMESEEIPNSKMLELALNSLETEINSKK